MIGDRENGRVGDDADILFAVDLFFKPYLLFFVVVEAIAAEDVEHDKFPATQNLGVVAMRHLEGFDRVRFGVFWFFAFGVPDVVVSDDRDVWDFDVLFDDTFPVFALEDDVGFGVALIDGEVVVAAEDVGVGLVGVGGFESGVDTLLVMEFVVG